MSVALAVLAVWALLVLFLCTLLGFFVAVLWVVTRVWPGGVLDTTARDSADCPRV